MREMVTGSGSLLVKSRTALVAWPLMSLTPKTSEFGKEAETERARLGVVGAASASFSTCNWDCVSVEASEECFSKLLKERQRGEAKRTSTTIDLQHQQQRRWQHAERGEQRRKAWRNPLRRSIDRTMKRRSRSVIVGMEVGTREALMQ